MTETYIKPESIVVREGLDRIRQDMGDVIRLGESIRKFGQLHPVIVTRDFELVAGGRRLAACIMLQKDVLYRFIDETDSLILRLIELEENIHRKELTPFEELALVTEIHELKVQQYGKAKTGPGNPGWRTEDTARLLGRSGSSVRQDIILHKEVKSQTDLKKAKTKNEIKKKSRAKRKAAEAVLSGIITKMQGKDLGAGVTINNRDAVEDMQEMPDDSVALLLTDPPYGISIDEIAAGVAQSGSGISASGFTFDDSFQKASDLWRELAKQSIRFCKKDAHAFVFTAPEHFNYISAMMNHTGWKCYPRPVVWIKYTSGQSNQPTMWPAACYEMAIYARRERSMLVTEAFPDWIQIDPLSPAAKMHPTEKPVTLLKKLIKYTTHENELVYDPFAGSFSTCVAAKALKRRVVGNDIMEECYLIGLGRLESD